MSDGRVAFGRDDVGRDLADTEFLAQIAWRETGNADLRLSATAGRLDKFWRAWSKGLTARVDRGQRRKRLASGSGLWPWEDSRQHPAKTVWSLIEKQDGARLSRWARQRLADVHAWSEERTAWELLALLEVLIGGSNIGAAAAFSL